MDRGGSLGSQLELASAFSAQVSAGVPIEIVEAENQVEAVLSSENGAQNISPADDAMDISVETEGQTFDSTRLSAVPGAVELPINSICSTSAVASASELKITGIDSAGVLCPPDCVGETPTVPQTQLMDLSTETSSSASIVQSQSILSSGFPSSLTNPAPSMLTTTHSSQLTQSVMDQLSGSQGLEISSEDMASLSAHGVGLDVGSSVAGSGRNSGGYPIPQMTSYSSTPSVTSIMVRTGRGRELLSSSSINYSDLDLSVAANTTTIEASSILNEPDSPSSPESNFDSSELLSNPLSHQDEVTHRLAQAGPIGMAAAAAIMSGSRKRKRQHMFETNPSFRKRQSSKLTKRLKETIEELSSRVGLQAVVVTYRPGKGNGKSEPTFKVFGAAPLVNIVKNQQESIVNEMETALHQQMPNVPEPLTHGDPLHELPPLDFDGIPTPVHKMTQAQLRTFIPSMLKYSTGRGKPGWGKEDVKPPWWPDQVPWANVRSDIRTPDQKRALQWTDALRRIVINCYLHHGRMDLLPEFSIEHLQQYLTPQVAEQLQSQIEKLQQEQQHDTILGPSNNSCGIMGPPVSGTSVVDTAAADEVAAALNEITEASGGVDGRDDPEVIVGGSVSQQQQQQVFTVDTGLGNTDVTGMPTLADANLAETAARLQKLADETGEVQYATQTVTVTDHDAKALGQPVGSTTTVLLTAYPGGHSGASGQDAGTTPLSGEQQTTSSTTDSASQQYLTSEPNTPGNIQVVYSASHIDTMPSGLADSSDVQRGSNLEDFTDASTDLAAELIREYSMGGEGLTGGPTDVAGRGVEGEGVPGLKAEVSIGAPRSMACSSNAKQTKTAES